MDLDALVKFVTSASPWAVIGLCAIAITYLYLEYRKHSTKAKADSAIKDALAAQKVTLDACLASTQATETAVASLNATLMAGFKDVVAEIATLNKTRGSVITSATSKVLVERQWRTLRDKCIRIITQSIERNHFKGAEDVVSRRVARLWRAAAEESMEDLDAIEGLNFPWKKLFEINVQQVWSLAWELAIPLYYRDLGPLTLQEALDDLTTRIEQLFDDALPGYYEELDDAAEEKATSKARKAVAEGRSHSEVSADSAGTMAHLLKTYKPGQDRPTDRYTRKRK